MWGISLNLDMQILIIQLGMDNNYVIIEVELIFSLLYTRLYRIPDCKQLIVYIDKYRLLNKQNHKRI